MKHVDPMGLSPGYAHQLGVPLRGLQFGGVISGGYSQRTMHSARWLTTKVSASMYLQEVFSCF